MRSCIVPWRRRAPVFGTVGGNQLRRAPDWTPWRRRVDLVERGRRASRRSRAPPTARVRRGGGACAASITPPPSRPPHLRQPRLNRAPRLGEEVGAGADVSSVVPARRQAIRVHRPRGPVQGTNNSNARRRVQPPTPARAPGVHEGHIGRLRRPARRPRRVPRAVAPATRARARLRVRDRRGFSAESRRATARPRRRSLPSPPI